MKLIYLEFAESESTKQMSILNKIKILLRMQEKRSTFFLDDEINNLRNELTNKMK